MGMRGKRSWALALAVVAAGAAHGVAVAGSDGAPRVDGDALVGPDAAAVPGEAIVRFEPGTTAAERKAVRDQVGVPLDQALKLPQTQVVAVDGPVAAAVARLERQPDVAFAQPNYRYHALAAAPDDSFFGDLWGLSDAAAPNRGVGALAAWDRSRGDGQTIAVVDTGVDLTHPDLAGNLWTNPGETPTGGDQDGNGKADDVHGYDFVDGDGRPDDYNFHGTHVAGTAAAIAGNDLGVAGVAPEASIMAVRVLDGDGSGDTATVADGIVYAAREGADVINLSLGGPAGEGDELMSDAVDEAATRGAVVVAAAGNEASNNDSAPTTPCTLPQANLICVAATTTSGGLASFSNYGATTVDVGAPGSAILSTKTDYGNPLLTAGFDNTATGWATSIHNGGIPWGFSTQHSDGTHSASDSPSGNYGAAVTSGSYAASELYTSTPLDLSGRRGCRMHYRSMYEIEAPDEDGTIFDALVVGAVADDDLDLADLATFVGESSGYDSGTFGRDEVSISELDGRDDVVPIFSLLSDGSVQHDGAYVDDLRLVCRDNTYVDAKTTVASYVAPGAGNYVELNGTSMASPHVAGIAALVRAAVPEATPAEVVEAIRDGAVPFSALAGKTVSGGGADALAAIEAAEEITADPPAPDPEPDPDPDPDPEPDPDPDPDPEDLPGSEDPFPPGETPPPGIGDPTAPPSDTGTPTAGAAASVDLGSAPERLRVARDGWLAYPFRAPGGLRVAARLLTPRAIWLGGSRSQRLTIANHRFVAPTSGRVVLRPRLSPRAVRVLRRDGRLVLRVTVTVRDDRGGTAAGRRSLTLLPPRS